MGFWRQILGLENDNQGSRSVPVVRAAADGGLLIRTPQELEEALRTGLVTSAGQAVTPEKAMRVAAVFACIRIRSGAIANMPMGIKRRVDDRTREDATTHPTWKVFNRKPNVWQLPRQFKAMMEANVLLRGHAEAVKVTGVGGRLTGLIPLHPDRVERRQRDDLALEYVWTRKDGQRFVFGQPEIFSLTGLSLDGVNGLGAISYAREAIGLSLAMEQHGGTTFRNGANVSGAFSLPAGRTLTEAQTGALKAQLDEFRQGGAREGRVIILEDGMEYKQMALSAEDAQWLDARKFSRSDIAMFFGVPPHLIGDTDKATSWGTGLETMSQGFVSFTLEDSLTMWEEAINLQCIDIDREPDIYCRFNRNALVRGDLKSRWEAYVKGLQWGVHSPNDVRAMEDENPRPDGDVYYDPPNTAGKSNGERNVDA